MKIRIQEPWWGAWKIFGWAKPVWGVGFKAKDINKAIKNKEKVFLKVYTFKETYVISPVTVKNYAELNKTIHIARHGTKLYVVPSTKLKKVKDEQSTKETPKGTQKKEGKEANEKVRVQV